MTRRTAFPSPAGYVLVVAVLAALVLAILMPVLVRYLKSESHDSVAQLVRARAGNLAEAAAQKIMARLTNDRALWLQAREATVPAVLGYDGSQTFADLPGGVYRVNLSSGPGQDQVTLLVKAREDKGGGLRGVRVVMQGWVPYSALGPSIPLRSDFHNVLRAHWAPLGGNSGGMTLPAETAGLRYPRKFSSWSLWPHDTNQAAPNTNNLDYWAFATEFPFQPGTPSLDQQYYLSRAVASNVPVSLPGGDILAGRATTQPAVSSPTGSGYFPKTYNVVPGDFSSLYVHFRRLEGANPAYVLVDPNAVLFFHATDPLPNFGAAGIHDASELILDPTTFLDVEALLFPGRVTFKGPGSGVIQATVPAKADLEYALAPSVWTDAPSMAAVHAGPGRCCYAINGVLFHGLLSATHVEGVGTRAANTEPVAAGVLVASPQFRAATDEFTVFYDEGVARRARLLNPAYQFSWETVPVSW